MLSSNVKCFFLLKEEDSRKEIRLIKVDQRSSMMSEDNKVSQDKFKSFFLMPPPHFQWCHILFLADQCFSPSVNVLCNVNYKGII